MAQHTVHRLSVRTCQADHAPVSRSLALVAVLIVVMGGARVASHRRSPTTRPPPRLYLAIPEACLPSEGAGQQIDKIFCKKGMQFRNGFSVKAAYGL